MTPARDVAIVVVGLNARDFVRGCFASLERAEWRGCTRQLIYVDNGSADGSPDAVRAEFPDVEVVVNARNVGYCSAANQGARLADARMLLFLNDDTEVLGDAVPMLVEHLDAHADVATAGARLVFADGRDQWSGRRFPDFLSALFGRRSWLAKMFPNVPTARAYMCKDEVARGVAFACDWVSAAGQIFRAEDFWAVGGFAEDYYYWHEMVQCLRIKRRGRQVVLVPRAVIVHHEGQGSGPRPFARQRFHILDFHRGAFRAYCEYRRIGTASPRAWLTAALLGGRAAILLARARLLTLSAAGPRP